MIEQIRDFFKLDIYTREIDRYRASLVYINSLIVSIYALSYMFLSNEWASEANGPEIYTMAQVAFKNPLMPASLMFYMVIILLILAVYLNRKGKVDYAQWSVMGVFYIIGVLLSVYSSNLSAGVINVMIFIILGGLIAGVRGTFVAIGVGVLTIGLRLAVDQTYVPEEGVSAIYYAIWQIIGASLLVYQFARYQTFSRHEGAIDVIEDNSVTATVLRQISQQVAGRVTPKHLLSNVVELINESFDYLHHVQIFLLSDDGTQAELIASTGDIGKILVNQNYTVPLGTQSIISRVIETGVSVVEGMEGETGRNERIEDTKVQVVLPLRIGTKILGALDIQSPGVRAFADFQAIATFQALSDSLALAIDNVAQYQRAEERLKENERLVSESRAALDEVQRLNNRLTGSAWADYLTNTSKDIGLMVDFESRITHPSFEPTHTLHSAIQDAQIIEEQRDGVQVIAVPLRVRGQVVGAMEFEVDTQQSVLPEDLELLQEVGERFGMAVENARLVDESQRLAEREAKVGQITGRLQTTSDIENMLHEATRSLREILSAERVSIRIGSPPSKG